MNKQYLCQIVRNIHDSIHDFIPISNFANYIIDNPKFQRLRKLRQLGTCHYVFPTASHTRFEHSVGTYYLAKQVLQTICQNVNQEDISDYLKQIPELIKYYQSHPIILDSYVIELIAIAGLCHDIGHGPFSHVFDDAFLPAIGSDNKFCSSHEERSELLIEIIINQSEVLCNIVSADEINFIKTLINPKAHHTGFIYQIISNTSNGLDVDKFDYLSRDIKMLNFQGKIDVCRLIRHIRVIDCNITYPKQALPDIYNLYYTRHQLHRQIYCHKVTVSIQYMIIDIMRLLDTIINFSNWIDNPDKFCDLTDEFIFEIPKYIKFLPNLSDKQKENLEQANQLINRLSYRDLYVCVGFSATSHRIDLLELKKSFESDNNLIIYQNKIGYVGGNKTNPLDNITVFSTKDAKVLSKVDAIKQSKTNITSIIPENYQEYLTMIFYKDKNQTQKIQQIKDICKDFFI
jgi:HD superfamily phosphohydrolase